MRVHGPPVREAPPQARDHKPETCCLVDNTVSQPSVAKRSSSNTIGGRGTAAKAAEEVKDAWYNKRAIIPAGTLVPVA